MAHVITVDGQLTLADILAEDLDVLFVGYNPNPLAVAERHYYARKANRFWEDLYEAGLVPFILRGPDDDLRLPEYGYGLTDLVKRPSPTIDALSRADMQDGCRRLDGLLERWRPRIVCFNGLGLMAAYRRWGRPPEGVLLHVVPSTSPRNNGRRQARLDAFVALHGRVTQMRTAALAADQRPRPDRNIVNPVSHAPLT